MTSKELVEFCMGCSSCEECCYGAECEAYADQFKYYLCQLKYLDFYSTEMYLDTEIII